jgi:peptidyl-tRNA hydrolase
MKREPELIEKWSDGGQAKVVVKVKNEQELYVSRMCTYEKRECVCSK